MLASIAAVALAQQLMLPDSSHATPHEVRALVDAAARRNFAARPYRVRSVAETEISIGARRASGGLDIVSVQQQASVLEWTRDSVAWQHIIGYRAEQAELGFAMTKAYRVGWIVPLLTSERVQLRLSDPAATSRLEKTVDPLVRPLRRLLAEPETLSTVHPLARDGWRFYEYPRADTIRERTPSGEVIDVVRIAVRQRADVGRGWSLFEGDVHVDARSLLVTRLRGRVFLVRSQLGKAVDAAADRARITGIVDMWNGPEQNGFRLPAVERLDIVSHGVAETSGELIRFVTHFIRHDVIESGPPLAPDAERQSLRYRATYAPRDSQESYAAWARPLGEASREADAAPLDDYYPNQLRASGPPRLGFRVLSSYEVFRFNKVEGPFTGASVAWYARDAMPGLSLRGVLGYAWSEETWRGYAATTLRRSGWTASAGVGRVLDLTNDFRSPYDSGGVWSSIFWSSDNYDYVDRRFVRVAAEKLLTSRGSRVRLELGVARDAQADKHRKEGIFFGPFRPNRIVDAGDYVRSIAEIDWNPTVQEDLTRERVGGGVRYERGDGDLDYQRVEAVLVARQPVGTVVFIGRLYGGSATGTVPTHQLFEIGATQNLPGYDYKAFAGDRAWIARLTAQYALPVLRAPFPFIAGFVIPGLAPELNAGVQTGMAWASDTQARDAVRRLGDKVDDETGAVLIDPATGAPVPTSVPTEELRATASVGLRVLSGAVYVGVALPIDATRDTRRALRLVFGFGRQL